MNTEQKGFANYHDPAKQEFLEEQINENHDTYIASGVIFLFMMVMLIA